MPRSTSSPASRSPSREGEIVTVRRAERRRQIDADEGGGRAACAEGGAASRYAARDITGLRPSAIARLGLAYVPQRENIFENMTVMENLEIGATAERRPAARPADRGADAAFPAAGRAAPPGGRHHVGRRAPDGGDGARADARALRSCCSTSPPPGSRRSSWKRCSSRSTRSTAPASRS